MTESTKPQAPAPTTPEPVRTKSGQHPAVKAFRRKLDSIAEDVNAQDDLQRRQEALLEQIRTPPPPPPDPEEPQAPEEKP